MKLIIANGSLIVVLWLTGIAAFSQSLGDVAKKEKERREKIKSEAKPITNTDTPRYQNGAITTGTVPQSQGAPKPGAEKAASEGIVQPKTAKAEPDEPVDFMGRPESFWRQTMSDARQKVKELENEANVLVLKIADLQTQFYRESDGFKQQEIQREIQKTFYQQDLNKDNLAKARLQLQDLEKEARKSGALPGWLIGRNP